MSGKPSHRASVTTQRWLAPLSVALAQALVCALALVGGPVTVSDDDFARVTIAQRFAEAPALDPTGSSWLPLPFYLQGTALALTDGSLGAARAFQLALALGSALLLYVAGTWMTRSRAFAALGALLGLLQPYVSELSVATVPEYQAAALASVGLAGLTQVPEAFGEKSVRILLGRRICSALALTAACACRYETWWLALAALGLTLDDARRAHAKRRTSLARSLVGVALIHALFPAIWLVHGAVNHGSATFFIARVVAYKQALGAAARPLGELLTNGYLGAAFSFAPAALLAPALLGVWLWRAGAAQTPPNGKPQRRDVGAPPPPPDSAPSAPPALSALLRPVLALGLMLLLLTVSELRGGAPTHHAERTVVSVWLVGALLAGALVERATTGASRARVIASVVATSALFALSAAAARVPAPFVERSAEEQLGRSIPKDARVVIATGDYGYFAVMAAAGAPSRFTVVDTHDPRNPKSAEPLTERALRLARAHHGALLVLPIADAPSSLSKITSAGSLGLFTLPR